MAIESILFWILVFLVFLVFLSVIFAVIISVSENDKELDLGGVLVSIDLGAIIATMFILGLFLSNGYTIGG